MSTSLVVGNGQNVREDVAGQASVLQKKERKRMEERKRAVPVQVPPSLLIYQPAGGSYLFSAVSVDIKFFCQVFCSHFFFRGRSVGRGVRKKCQSPAGVDGVLPNFFLRLDLEIFRVVYPVMW